MASTFDVAAVMWAIWVSYFSSRDDPTGSGTPSNGSRRSGVSLCGGPSNYISGHVVSPDSESASRAAYSGAGTAAVETISSSIVP